MQTLLTPYVFDTGAKTITIPGVDSITPEGLGMITNVTRGVVLYQFNHPNLRATVAGNVITLVDADLTGMSVNDVLRIDMQALYGDKVNDKLVVGNARSSFKDGFSNPDVAQPDSTQWDLVNDNASGHIVQRGGDALGASYLRVSLSPFTTSKQVVLTSKRMFRFPFRFGYALTMSQRNVGQEAFAGVVGVDNTGAIEQDANIPADKAITGATASVSTTTYTYTSANHGLKGGDRVLIYGCADSRMNAGPTTVTVVDVNTFSITWTSLTTGSYSTIGGQVRYLDGIGGARNGAGVVADQATATTAWWMSKRNSTRQRMVAATIASTVATQSAASPYSDAFNPSSINEMFLNIDEANLRSTAADSLTSQSGMVKWNHGVPDEDRQYKIQYRFRNLANLSRPIARITAISKTGTTTATVTTDTAHGLTVNDFVQVTGVRDQTNFASHTAQTQVSSVIDANNFTVVIGTAATASSLDGVVSSVHGSSLNTMYPQSIQTLTKANGILTLTGNATWATPLPGEIVHVWGLNSSLSTYEGAYKVLRVNTTSLELDASGSAAADIGTTNTGGSVIKRTDCRIHLSRMLDYTRHYTEIVGGKGNTGDINNSVPVSVTNTVGVTAGQGSGSTTAQWNAAGYSGLSVADQASGAVTASATSSAFTSGLSAGIGAYAQSFSIAVTAVSGTNPTLDVGIEESWDGGTTWSRIYDFERITAAGVYTTPPIRMIGSRIRYVGTVGGTSPSFTRAITRFMFSTNPPLFRRLIDRTINPNTASSVTPTYLMEGIQQLQMIVNMGAITTTAPTIQLEGSEDNSTWYALGAAVTPTASTTVAGPMITGVLPKFVRARISGAGSGATLGYVCIKGTGA